MLERAKDRGAKTESLRQRIYLQLRAAMAQGSFQPGTRLPATRELALVHGVSRNTVLWAMERLQAEGYVLARVGDGSYVAPGLRGLAPPLVQAQRASSALQAPPDLSARGRLMASTGLAWNPPRQAALPFRIGAPEVASFPFGLWDRLQRQASSAQRQARAQYLDPAGDPALR